MMLHELSGTQAVQVAHLGLHHDGQMAQALFDNAFGDAID